MEILFGQASKRNEIAAYSKRLETKMKIIDELRHKIKARTQSPALVGPQDHTTPSQQTYHEQPSSSTEQREIALPTPTQQQPSAPDGNYNNANLASPTNAHKVDDSTSHHQQVVSRHNHELAPRDRNEILQQPPNPRYTFSEPSTQQPKSNELAPRRDQPQQSAAPRSIAEQIADIQRNAAFLTGRVDQPEENAVESLDDIRDQIGQMFSSNEQVQFNRQFPVGTTSRGKFIRREPEHGRWNNEQRTDHKVIEQLGFVAAFCLNEHTVFTFVVFNTLTNRLELATQIPRLQCTRK